MNGFSRNIQYRPEMTQETIWNTLGITLITMRLQIFCRGQFVSVSNITENGWTTFHEIFSKSKMTQGRIGNI